MQLMSQLRADLDMNTVLLAKTASKGSFVRLAVTGKGLRECLPSSLVVSFGHGQDAIRLSERG